LPSPSSPTRSPFAHPWAAPARVHGIPPSIDPFSAKNEPMSGRNVQLTLSFVGLLDGSGAPPAVPFARRDGSPGRINRRVDVLQKIGSYTAIEMFDYDALDRLKKVTREVGGVAVDVDDYAYNALGALKVNAGVTLGILPTTGLPMPFVSYGGSSMVFSSMAVGVLLNISSQTDLAPRFSIPVLTKRRDVAPAPAVGQVY